jgi:hypothetical protein
VREALVRGGVADGDIEIHLDEVDAVRAVIAQARPGDILVLPIHATTARVRVTALLDRLVAEHWSVGATLPVEPIDLRDTPPT